MKHRAQRIFKGCYTYRGYIVENTGTCWAIGIGNPISYTTLDAMNTKSDAMTKIDCWLNEAIT